MTPGSLMTNRATYDGTATDAPPSGAALTVDTMADLVDHVGSELGPGSWLLVDQDLVDRFGRVTGDENWYHHDVERAARELPSGTTIAHGLLTLALVPGLRQELLHVRHHGRALNYGQDRVRFPAPVPVGSRVRLRVRVGSTAPHRAGVLVRIANTIELEGAEKPALVADSLTLVIMSEMSPGSRSFRAGD